MIDTSVHADDALFLFKRNPCELAAAEFNCEQLFFGPIDIYSCQEFRRSKWTSNGKTII